MLEFKGYYLMLCLAIFLTDELLSRKFKIMARARQRTKEIKNKTHKHINREQKKKMKKI